MFPFRRKSFEPAGTAEAPPRLMPAIGRYTALNWAQRHPRLCYAALILVAAVYGYFFAIYGRYLLVYLLYPLVPLMLGVIWLLPDTGRAPVKTLSRLLMTFAVALLCWPDYLAFALPGLPWVTAIRLVTVPMAVLLLISLSISKVFRDELKDTLDAAPWMWRAYLAFMAMGVVTLPLSSNVAMSLNKLVVAQLVWTAIFFTSVYVFRNPRTVRFFAVMVWLIILFHIPVVFYEFTYHKLPWAGRIPSFLVVEDERIQKMLAGGVARSSTGIYRTQSKFTTPLGLGEFLALTTPFIVHYMMTARWLVIRFAAFLMLPAIFWVVMNCDSRLAVIGFFLTILLYILVWSVLRWRNNPRGLLGPALMMAYPALLAAFLALSLVWRRLEVMVWGGGAQQASTEARKAMYREGIPLVFKNPIGNGMGQGAEALGFRNPAGVLTIDTYYMVVALEYGVIGFIAFYGMIIYGIFKSGEAVYYSRDKTTAWLAPIGIALCNFLIIKSVFSQQENHPLVFMLLGMVVALVARERAMKAKVGSGAVASDA